MNIKIALSILMGIFLIAPFLYAREPNKSRDINLAEKPKHYSEAEILAKLNNPDWHKQLVILMQIRKLYLYQPNLKKQPGLKTKLTELLESRLKFERDYIRDKISLGKSLNQARDSFYKEYLKQGYIGYIDCLIYLVLGYRDIDTIPVLLDAFNQYGGVIEARTFLVFGKPAIDKFIQITTSGNKNQKEAAYSLLAGWVQWSLSDSQLEDEIKLDNDLKLEIPEIQKVKNVMINGLNTDNNHQIFAINNGLFAIIQETKDIKVKKRLTSILKRSLTNPEGYMRKFIIQSLGKIGNLADVEDLTKLKNDPYLDSYTEHKRNHQIKATGKTDIKPVYPVREAAREAIEKIKARHGMNKNGSNSNRNK